MPFRVACPSCDHELNLRDDLLGKRIRCSECGEAMTAKPASPIRSQDVKAPAIRKNRETIEEEDEVSETASKKKKRKSDASTSRDIPWGLVLGGAAAFVTVSILVVIVVMLGRGSSPTTPVAPQASLATSKTKPLRVTDPNLDRFTQELKDMEVKRVKIVPLTITAPPSAKKARPKRPAPQIDLSKIGVGAVVDLSASPAGALFEAKVLGADKLTWVERTQIDKVLAEQDLQALFHAEGGLKRVNLGKILKADLLVLLRSGTRQPQEKGASKSPTLDLVVCETRHGLRVAAQSVAMSGKAEDQVVELEGILRDAMGKLSEKITDICAVPPFISQDLDYQHNHLRAAFSRVLEQHLLRRKGVLVVELAEAQALTKEASVAGGSIERPLPLYFMGDFRNDGAGDARRISLNLKLQRGEKVIGERRRERIEPKDASKTLSSLAGELVEKLLASPAISIIDSDAEIAQLEERSAAFQRLGNWPESLNLLEAALLIDPEATDLNRRAAHVAAMEVLRAVDRGEHNPNEAFPALFLYRRALQHLESGYRRSYRINPPVKPGNGRLTDSDYTYPTSEFSAASWSFMRLRNHMRYYPPPDLVKLMAEVAKAEKTIFLSLVRGWSESGVGDESVMLALATQYLPDRERIAALLALIQEMKDLPYAKERTALFLSNRSMGFVPIDASPKLIEQLAADPHPELRAAAELLRIDRDKNAARLKAAPPKQVVEAGPTAMAMPRLQLAFPEGNKSWLAFHRVVPLGPGLDLFVAGNSFYLMRQKGVAKRIWTVPEPQHWIESVCYDGRYVWATVTCYLKLPRVVVIDPEDEKVVQFTAEDGLPLAAPDSLDYKSTFQKILAAPLDPGRAMLVGSFGRAWFAIATFDPAKGKEVKVFHEAREKAASQDSEAWRRTTMAFEPLKMFVLAAGPGERRVVVRRGCPNQKFELHPLIVDPRRLTLEVMESPLGQGLNYGVVHDGSIYFLEFNRDSRHLHKITLPGDNKETAVFPLPDERMGANGNTVAIRGDDIFVATSKRWWHGSMSTKKFRPIGPVTQDQSHVMGLSNHYGVLLCIGNSPHAGIYQLTSAEKGMAE